MSKPKSATAPAAADFPTFRTAAVTIPELMWSHTLGDGERMDYAEAQKAIAELNRIGAGGFSDWRLPTVEELFAQTDRSRYNPAVDPERFPDTKPGFYWSSTPDVSDPEGCAWGVYFYDGNAGIHCRVYGGFVRAVRSLPSASPGQ
jgi:hypothetical protein